MRGFKLSAFCVPAALMLGMIAATLVRADATGKPTEGASHGPMVVKSKTLEVDNAQKLITFTGEVNARRDDFVIDCQKMLLYYEQLPAPEQTGETGRKIKEIIATGQVRISRSQGGVATAEKAVFYQDDQKVILTGKPMVKQGTDIIEGDRITLFLKENRSVVESSKDKKVTATIFPKGGER